MNDKTREVINSFEKNHISAEFIKTVKKIDVIEIEHNAYSQGAVICGILDDHGFSGDLCEYLVDTKYDKFECGSNCNDDDGHDHDPISYVIELNN